MAIRSLKNLATAVGILSLSSAQAMAQLPPERPYDAVYQTLADSSSSMQTHIISDGRGHTRSESTISGQQYVSIMDSTKRVCYALNAQMKTATKVPFDTSAYYDPNYAKSQKPIGVKVVEGHPCHGWLMNSGGHQTQTWVADDIGCTVLVTSDNKPFMRLVKFQPYAANASMFTVPSDYRIVEMPTYANGSPYGVGNYGAGSHGSGSTYGSGSGSDSGSTYGSGSGSGSTYGSGSSYGSGSNSTPYNPGANNNNYND